jgi:hypothetical protein
MTAVKLNEDERIEKTVIGGAIALALIVGLGFSAHKVGLLDSFLGSKGPARVAAGVFEVIKAEAKGVPEKVLLSGTVATDDDVKSLQAAIAKALPGAEIKNALRADARAKEKKREIVRISLAADAINEAWPRPRFGDVKRLELLWKDDKLTVRGAVFSTTTNAAFQTAFNKIPEAQRGAIQLRDVLRSNVPAAKLQDDVLVALAGRAVVFTAEAAIKADDAAAAAMVASLAPLLTDLTGLEVVLSAGAADRALAMKQAEAFKAALVAAGADAAGLRPVPAPRNNLLSLIVREKE